MSEQCSECDASFASREELIQHSHAHAKVPGSDRGVESREPLEPERGFLCMVCGAHFGSPQALALHNLEPHTSGPTVPKGSGAERKEAEPPVR